MPREISWLICFGQLLASMIGQQNLKLSFLLAREEVCVLGTLPVLEGVGCLLQIRPAGESYLCIIFSNV